MNLPKAIEILNDIHHQHPAMPPSDQQDAVKLGIEAMKAWHDFRISWLKQACLLLPGETEE